LNKLLLKIPYLFASVLLLTTGPVLAQDFATQAEAYMSERVTREQFTGAVGYGGQHYGYGIVITGKFGQPQWYHGGGIKGFASAIQRYPQSGICVVVLANAEFVKSWDVATGLAALLIGRPADSTRLH
jgi:Beta-lactamase